MKPASSGANCVWLCSRNNWSKLSAVFSLACWTWARVASTASTRPWPSARSNASERWTAVRRYRRARASAKSDRAPRGHSSVPTTTPMAEPTARSSILTNPTLHPTGLNTLNRTTIRTVNAACPARNDSADGVYAARNTATGKAAQSTAGSWPNCARSLPNSANWIVLRRTFSSSSVVRAARVVRYCTWVIFSCAPPRIAAILRGTSSASKGRSACCAAASCSKVSAIPRVLQFRRMARCSC